MIKLSFSKPRFYTFNNNRSTGCIYKCQIRNTSTGCVFKAFVVRGVTTCCDTDEFDYRKGRIIAESKAKQEAYRIAKKLVDAKETLDRISFLNAQYSFYVKMKHLYNFEKDHIKTLIET